MMRIEAIIAACPGLDEAELRGWVARGWVRPAEQDGIYVFAAVDLARVRLIRDLRADMEVAEETMPLVLSLLDQLYDQRRALQRLMRALEHQPDAVRQAVLEALGSA
jgi:chaperone modulatory protein CbpM